jgi:AraC family transcriptional regulator of adaptative response / DNA-3-methyladenine glycosylase II
MDGFEATYRAVESRDPRWDGRVFVGVTSTGIYCRPICPVPMPRREHVRFYGTAAAAEHGGFRACRRCRPEQSPDSPDWDVRSDLVGRALRLIADGVADEEAVDGVARRLAVSTRHLHRMFVAQLGVSPGAVAQTRRTALAKQLLDQTDLRSTDVAFAAGFRSLRSYNAAMQRSFGRTPKTIRTQRRGGEAGPGISLRLAYRPPLARAALLTFLAERAIPGTERIVDGGYERIVETVGGPRPLRLEPAADASTITLTIDGIEPVELTPIVGAARRLLDLDADPVRVDATLGADALIRPFVDAVPGVRLPGAFDPWQTTVLAILAQGISLRAARSLAGRIAALHGSVVDLGGERRWRPFPGPDVVADADLAGAGLPARKQASLRILAREIADGRIDLRRGEPARVLEGLATLPGVGPWTTAYVALRVLRDPDAFPPGDAAVRAAFRRLGRPDDAAAIARAAESWRPWRGYAVARLWAQVR